MNRKSSILVVIAFFATFSTCLLFIVPAIKSRITTEQIRLEHLITDKSKKISEAISIPVNQLYTVASYIEQKNGNLDDIEDFAATIVNNEYIRNLIIAPGGIVTKVFPDTEDNRNVLGLNYNENTSQGNREAILAAEKKELLLAGPFTTVVGDKAISGRYPVVLKDARGKQYLWGIISITLKYPDVMTSTNLDSLSKQGYTYELWHSNVDTGEHEVIMSNGNIDEKSNYVEQKINVLNAEWYLRLAPIPQWHQYMETWIYLLLSLIISASVSIMVKKNYQLKLVKKQLEITVQYDPLTNVLNRQGLFSRLDTLIKYNKKFLIYYIDLNNFKQINDRYGHDVGDSVLREFARRVSLHTNDSHLFARMGGDEFVVVHVEQDSLNKNIDNFWQLVNEEFEKPILEIKGKDLHISFSKGSASYSSETDSLDEIISKADREMYMEKKATH